MTLEETARSLCEPRVRHPDFERALLLFNFQVEVLSPEKPKVSSYARLHAAVKFLQYIKSVQDSPSSSPLIKRSALPGYEENLKEMIEREGGVLCLGQSWSRRQLTDDIDARWSEARDAAHMVSFSHRFAQHGDNRKGGITMARSFVCQTRKISSGTMKNRWREYRRTAVVVYLMRKVDLRPARLTSKKFVEKLLKQADDIDRLRQLFAAYRDVRNVLQRRGYKCDPIAIDGLSNIKLDLKLREFSSDELKAINNRNPDL